MPFPRHWQKQLMNKAQKSKSCERWWEILRPLFRFRFSYWTCSQKAKNQKPKQTI